MSTDGFKIGTQVEIVYVDVEDLFNKNKDLLSASSLFCFAKCESYNVDNCKECQATILQHGHRKIWNYR